MKKIVEPRNSIIDECKKIQQLGLAVFSLSVKENNLEKKNIVSIPKWNNVNLNNCMDYVKLEDNFVAIVTGPKSYIFVLDIDDKVSDKNKNGLQYWNTLIQRYDDINTWKTASPNGGFHYYFKYDERLHDFKNMSNITIEGKQYTIDIRTNGGNIFAPPSKYMSIHGNIKCYEWINSPYDVELARMPDWLFALLNNPKNIKSDYPQISFKTFNPIPTSKSSKAIKSSYTELCKILKVNCVNIRFANGRYFVYYNDDKCVSCDKEHKRKDGQYVIIESNLDNVIQVKYTCWQKCKNNCFFWLSRKNPAKKSYTTDSLKKWLYLDDSSIETLFKYIPTGKHQLNIDVEFANIKSNIHQTNINKRILKADDLDIDNHDTIYIKSIEGTNKTGAIIDKMIAYMDRFDKFIILNPNISTLSSIKSRMDDRNIKFVYYENATETEIIDAKILIITMNSLPKIINRSIYSLRPDRILLWNDELNVTFNYILSPTIDSVRQLAYDTYELLITHSNKVIFTDADINDKMINIIEDIRKKSSTIVQNCYIHTKDPIMWDNGMTIPSSQRNYHDIDDYAQILNLINESINNNERIMIVSDSKTQTDLMYIRSIFNLWESDSKHIMDLYNTVFENISDYHDTTQKYNELCNTNEEYNEMHDIPIMTTLKTNITNDSILLINSENNNTTNIIQRINKIIKERNINIFITSPSLGTGSNVDVIHFDRIFGIFHGKSVTSEMAQQQLNRVRHFNNKDHYLYFSSSGSSKILTDSEFYDSYIAKLIYTRNKKLKSPEGLVLTVKNGFFVNELQGFIPKIVAYVKSQISISRSNFKYETLKNIISRGHNVFINNCNYDELKHKKEKDIRTKKVDIKIKKFNYKLKADDIINTENICSEFAKQLDVKANKTKEEKNMLEKFYFMKIYRVKHDVEIDDLKAFYMDAKDNRYMEKVDRLNNVLSGNAYDTNEEKTIDSINHEKKKIINTLLKKVGFTGILDTNEVEYVTTDIVDGIDKDYLKKIRMLFMNDGNIGRLQGKPTKRNIIMLLARLLKHMYGIKIINSIPKRITTNNKRYYVSVVNISILAIIRDYLIIKQAHNNNIIHKIEKIIEPYQFCNGKIHGYTGYYIDYLKSKNKLKEPNNSKNLFIDLDNI